MTWLTVTTLHAEWALTAAISCLELYSTQMMVNVHSEVPKRIKSLLVRWDGCANDSSRSLRDKAADTLETLEEWSYIKDGCLSNATELVRADAYQNLTGSAWS